jgi:2-dehydro-3-deoxygalactonokinase
MRFWGSESVENGVPVKCHKVMKMRETTEPETGAPAHNGNRVRPMARLIGLDWGTSQLRAYLMGDGGRLLDSRSRPWGIRQLPNGGFDAALAEISAGWPAAPLIAAGMVGSRSGWREVPYVNLPGGRQELAASLVSVTRNDGADLNIVPGLRHAGIADVMRGEETQIVGAIELRSALADDAVLVLPGTHSKWATLDAGRVADFTTYMTGELFALLRSHSILGEGAVEQPLPPQEEHVAFLNGVRAARESGAAGGLSHLFSTRALMLDGRLPAAAVPDYLSGLLIGEELRAALAAGRIGAGASLHLVGDAVLCARYRQAAAAFDLDATEPIDGAAARGLWCIADAARLIAAAAPRETEGTRA